MIINDKMKDKNKLIQEIEYRICENIKKLGGVPSYMIPKVNQSNDYSYPYIDISNDGTLYIVIEERGVEYSRELYPNIDVLIDRLFWLLTLELAVENLKREGFKEITSLMINQKQNELLVLLLPNGGLSSQPTLIE